MAKFRRTKSLGIIAVGICLMVVAVILIFSRLNKPYSVITKVSETAGTKQQTYSIDLTPVLESNTYVSFDYPKGLSLRSSALIDVNSVADYTFSVKDVYSWTLAIDVSNTPMGQVDETSSFQIRQQDPSRYSEQITTVNGATVDIMTDTSFMNGFSKVAYLTHGDLVATVSLTGDDSAGTKPLVTTFNMVLNSWHWQ